MWRVHDTTFVSLVGKGYVNTIGVIPWYMISAALFFMGRKELGHEVEGERLVTRATRYMHGQVRFSVLYGA